MPRSSASALSFERERLERYIEREEFWKLQRRRLTWITVSLFILVGPPTLIYGALEHGHGCNDGARNQAFEIGKTIALFEMKNGRLPTTLSELTYPSARLKALLESVPRDAWGRDYLYIVPGVREHARFTIASAGPDGRFFTADDVGNW